MSILSLYSINTNLLSPILPNLFSFSRPGTAHLFKYRPYFPKTSLVCWFSRPPTKTILSPLIYFSYFLHHFLHSTPLLLLHLFSIFSSPPFSLHCLSFFHLYLLWPLFLTLSIFSWSSCTVTDPCLARRKPLSGNGHNWLRTYQLQLSEYPSSLHPPASIYVHPRYPINSTLLTPVIYICRL